MMAAPTAERQFWRGRAVVGARGTRGCKHPPTAHEGYPRPAEVGARWEGAFCAGLTARIVPQIRGGVASTLTRGKRGWSATTESQRFSSRQTWKEVGTSTRTRSA